MDGTAGTTDTAQDESGSSGAAGSAGSAGSTPPRWFTEALSTRPSDCSVAVKGTDIHYLQWGEVGRPALVLVHGGAAHAQWWSFIAPLLTSQYHVIAPDLSGHGDSGRRAVYAVETWADEIMACVADAAMAPAPILVGNSMGGLVTIAAANLYGERLAGAVVIDSPVRRPDPESEEGERGRMFRNPKTYPTAEEAAAHFHLQPPQPCENDYIVQHIARTSIRSGEAGWTWKFDPRVFQRNRQGIDDYLGAVRCRIAVFKGQYSDLVTPDVQDYIDELLGRSSPIVEIPEAYHHVPLDQPLALVAALRAILADWQHSVPKHAPGA
ncbi:MAG: alpha/beta hydrolase [Acidimicrobiales bacterium]